MGDDEEEEEKSSFEIWLLMSLLLLPGPRDVIQLLKADTKIGVLIAAA